MRLALFAPVYFAVLLGFLSAGFSAGTPRPSSNHPYTKAELQIMADRQAAQQS
jgi:hypothetical protein